MSKNSKTSSVLGAVALSSVLLGCSGKSDTPPAHDAGAASAPAASASAAVRTATYDPNLKPTNIVWDSPEKQRKWEAAQAQRAAASAP